MIELTNISKSFGQTKALSEINLRLEKGRCVGLIGPNACGKTTLIKHILGMVFPDKGQILVNGRSVAGDVSYKNHIGYMPQIGRYPENMSIIQVIDMIRNIRHFDGKEDLELFHSFGLDTVSYKKMRTLSGGTTQKVSATLAFMFNPTVLVLDEPTAGLDPMASEILREKIIKVRQDKLILISSHLLSELDDLLTDVIFMEEAHIKFHLTVSELFERTGEERVSRAIHKILKAGVR